MPAGTVPGIERHLADSARLGLRLLPSIIVLLHLMDLVLGRTRLWPSLNVLAVICVVCAALEAVRRRWPGRGSEWLVFALSGVIVFDMASYGYVLGRPNPTISHWSAIPVLLTVLAPVRPVFVGGLALAVTAVTVHASLPVADDAFFSRLLAAVSFGVFSVVSAGANRRRWREVERARARNQLIASDRLAQMGQLSAALAHELKTPLAAALNQLHLADELTSELEESIGHPQVEDGDLREICRELQTSHQAVGEATRRCGEIVQSMRQQARNTAPSVRVAFSVPERVRTVTRMLRRALSGGRVVVRYEGPPEATLLGSPVLFEQVLSNLVRNAIDAMHSSGIGGVVVVGAVHERDAWVLRVTDDGPGVPGERREQIFEQAYSTGSDGLGLGLWICRNIAESAFGGSLAMDPDQPERGARFVWLFPDGAALPVPQAAQSERPQPPVEA